MSIIMLGYYFMLTVMMAMYDYSNPRYFSQQTLSQVDRVTWIYSFILAHILFICLNLTSQFKKSRAGRRQESCQSLILPVITVLFFVNDEMERL